MRVRGDGCQCRLVRFPKPNHFASSLARERNSLTARCQQGATPQHQPGPLQNLRECGRARAIFLLNAMYGQSRKLPSSLAPFMVHHLPFQTPLKGMSFGNKQSWRPHLTGGVLWFLKMSHVFKRRGCSVVAPQPLPPGSVQAPALSLPTGRLFPLFFADS